MHLRLLCANGGDEGVDRVAGHAEGQREHGLGTARSGVACGRLILFHATTVRVVAALRLYGIEHSLHFRASVR
ncbi:MAG: hypothetical protein ABIR54_05595 [Burkholderiaceae bacterium]